MRKRSQGITFILLSIFLQVKSFETNKLPKFDLISDQRLEDENLSPTNVPKILVTFPSGETDQMELWHHYFNEDDRALPKGILNNSQTPIFIAFKVLN